MAKDSGETLNHSSDDMPYFLDTELDPDTRTLVAMTPEQYDLYVQGVQRLMAQDPSNAIPPKPQRRTVALDIVEPAPLRYQ